VRDNRSDSVAVHLWDAFARGISAISHFVRGEVVKHVGGPARARVIVLFGAVLALSGADAATVGAAAPQLEASLHIGNAKIGLLSSVGLLVGAVFVIPVGLLVDRTKRMPLLAISIVLWSIASLAAAFAGSYWHLVLWRLALGAVTATAGPAIASLTGDYFPARERGRVYAYIFAGETAGTAVGFILTGTLASLISWRAAFIALALPGFWLARELYRTVPEPLRGGQSRLEPGAEAIVPRPVAEGPAEEDGEPAAARSPDEELAYAEAERRGIKPDPQRVLKEDPQKMTLSRAISYTLSIPSNLMLIVGSSLGYFYFAGLSTFALLFVKGHYHASQATSELGLGLLVGGALIGTIVSGQVTDRMLRNGVLKARMLVPAGCYAGAVVCFIPGVLGTHLMPALWFDVAGAALVSAANPPLQAAKLDIMPAGLWGRAESTRTLVRSLAQALAPLAFGGVADLYAGFAPRQVPIGAHAGHVSSSSATGLEIAFLVMCVALAAAAYSLFRAAHTYPTDVVTAAASQAPTPGDDPPAPDAGIELSPPRGRRRPPAEPQLPDDGDFDDDPDPFSV
jgi:MFS family permease